MATAKQNFYKWHRWLGLTALVPVIMWTVSGLSHPFMSNWFRPTIPQEVYKPATQAELKPTLSIRQVLDKNAISSFRNFGLISYKDLPYYQVMGRDSIISYYSAFTAVKLNNGDKLYAEQLARYFTQDSVSKVKAITLQKDFDGTYQPINRLLPVWKVAFDRQDGMDVYIETSQSRMGTFNNTTRKVMLQVFEQLHTWDFLEAIGGEQFRIVVLLIVVTAMFLALVSGLMVYGFFWKQFKTVTQKRRESGKADNRVVHRYHRQLGLIVSFVMFTFIVSGAFHLVVKLHNEGPKQKAFEQTVSAADMQVSNLSLPLPDSTIVRSGLVRYQDSSYYQMRTSKKEIRYFNTITGKELINGDAVYASYLAGYYNGKKVSADSVTQIRQFTEEYGFINKRLPVQQVSLAGNENWYIETSTSQLATKVAGIDRAEGFSFIFLHKYFGMTWAGKNIRDIVSMLAALGVLVTALFGLASFIKNK